MPMKLKLDDSGHVVVKDGNPVYVHEDGKEIPFDANTTVATIGRLNGEAKSNRERFEAAEERLKGFAQITDVAAALDALEKVGKIDAKKLIDAGEVDKVRGEAKKAFDTQLKAIEESHAPVLKERDQLKAQLVGERVGGAFSRSKFITDKLAIPTDMVQARFGDAFKLEGDNVVAYDKQGNQIFSRAKPGQLADFDEALEILVDAYPYKDHILKGTGAAGGGAGGGGAATGGKGKTITRAQHDAMTPADRQAHFKAGGAIADA
jgi:hypothetical protein